MTIQCGYAMQIMSKTAATESPWARIPPGIHDRSTISPGGYAYSSIWGGEVSGSSCSPSGLRRGWRAGLSSRCLRFGCCLLITVDDVVGAGGLMLSIVSICICLNLQLFVVYIGSPVNTLGRLLACGRSRVCTWLSPVWLCENHPDNTGLC